MLSKFDYYKPETLEEAVAYLDKNPGANILAGGTDLMLLLRKNAIKVEYLLDIKGIPETKKFSYVPGEGMFIGASATINEIAENETVREKYTALALSSDSLASFQIRNRATLIGNICHASPGADSTAPLLVYDAKVHIASSEGTRVVEIEDFFTGLKKTTVKDNEVVIGVSLPEVESGDKSIYLRKARIKGHDLCNVGLAMRLTANKEMYIAIAAVEPIPIKLSDTPGEIRMTSPLLGQHTEEILKELLNYDDKKIDELKNEEIF